MQIENDSGILDRLKTKSKFLQKIKKTFIFMIFLSTVCFIASVPFMAIFNSQKDKLRNNQQNITAQSRLDELSKIKKNIDIIGATFIGNFASLTISFIGFALSSNQLKKTDRRIARIQEENSQNLELRSRTPSQPRAEIVIVVSSQRHDSGNQGSSSRVNSDDSSTTSTFVRRTSSQGSTSGTLGM